MTFGNSCLPAAQPIPAAASSLALFKTGFLESRGTGAQRMMDAPIRN